MAELAKLISTAESAIKSTFGHSIMNYLMLMMVDHHVHYHVVPRYDGSREFANLVWVDNGWPTLPQLLDSQHKNNGSVLQKIQEALIASVEP